MGDRHKALEISIHALCEEGDQDVQSYDRSTELISIHALCEEGDCLNCEAPVALE